MEKEYGATISLKFIITFRLSFNIFGIQYLKILKL